MSRTYLELVNDVLVRLNETPLNEDNFIMARGIHATVKNAVVQAEKKVNNAYNQWPWNAAQHTMELVQGVSEYAWPENFSNVDWYSFSIESQESPNLRYEGLHKVNRNQWYGYQRSRDYDLGISGRNVPRTVFEAHGYGFGVSPAPNQNYTVTYRYYKTPKILKEWNDVSLIPEAFDYVITDAALYHMKSFKDDPEGTGFARQEFQSSLKELRDAFSVRYDTVRDSRVRRF